MRRESVSVLKSIIGFIVVLVILGGGGFYAYRRVETAKKAGARPTYAVARAQVGTMVADVTGYGPLEPALSSPIEIQTSGTIASLTAQAGETVQKGQVLATISDPSLTNTITQDQQQLAADIDTLDTALGLPQGTTPPTTLPQGGITVTAPITGRVEKFLVSQNATVQAGTALAEIVDDGEVVMDVDLVPADAAEVQVGDTVTALFHNFSGSVSGTVTSVSTNPVPSSSGTAFVYPTTITLNNTFDGQPGLLAPGMAAQVQIHTANGSVTLPGTQTVTSYGQTAEATSTIAASVLSLTVQPNTWVTKGEPIMTLGGPAALAAIASDQTTIQNDENNLKAAEASKQDLVVTAPISGVIENINGMVGETVGRGYFLGQIFDPNAMVLNISVSELQLANIQVGQSVIITIPGLPGKSFSGTVKSIGTFGNYNNGISTFTVSIRVTGSGTLKPGMTADAEIEVASVPNALMVPVEAVLQQGTQAEVEVLGPNGVHLVPVQVGLVNSTYAQITSGLSAGQEVVTGSASLPSGTATYTGTGTTPTPTAKQRENLPAITGVANKVGTKG